MACALRALVIERDSDGLLPTCESCESELLVTSDRSSAEVWALCRVPKAEICFVRYTLEAYEGLCVPTTLPGGEGRLRLLTSRDQRAELEAVLLSLAEEVSLMVESWSKGVGDPP